MSRTPRSLAALLSALVLASGSLLIAPTVAVAAGPVPRFLTLPFEVTPRMHIQQAQIWQGPPHDGDAHNGIDYIKGRRDRSATWKTFPVYAAAPGYACANLTGRKGCIVGTGNRVLITHTINGKTYRTYYGHLEAISTRIPLGGKKTVFVKRGELLGYAGYSGDPCCVRHLHFQLFDPSWTTVDPYGIDGTRGEYPDPAGDNRIGNGRRSYWISDPPTPPARFIDRPVKRIPYPDKQPTPDRTPRPKPERTPRPKPERTPRPTRKPTRTPRPERTPRPPATPAPTSTPALTDELRPGPSLVAAAQRSLTWWGTLIVELLQALRGGL
jgi:murein DD-endopeptidase MepM/ murein hydrolase activator NlpD